ncbi:MAG: alpha/beta hydrolase [Treponema sp.]|nr:alpha/beta hydrolase [Treponema sp.]
MSLFGALYRHQYKSPYDAQLPEPGMAADYPVYVSPQGPIVLYFHGGVYVLGSIESSLLLCAPLAEALSLPMFLFEYRLAPEHPYPAALDDALAAYHWLRSSGYQGEQIVFLGDSAGGGLALAAAMALRDRDEPLPGALLLYSPWTDLTNSSDSHRTNAGRDVMLTTGMLQRWARSYAGSRPLDDPYISPRFGSFKDLPPILIQVDESEIFLDDSRSVADAARAAGVPVELEIWQGLWHVWPAVGTMIPETMLSFQRIKDFLSPFLKYTN